jgi:hypothetical protein
MVMALLLDLSNIAGGLLLAAVLFQRLPRVGSDLALAAKAAWPWGWIVGLVALVCGGYYLIVHLTDGPHVFHFELVAIAVGVILLWDRLRGRPAAKPPAQRLEPNGTALLLAVFGIIAIIVGFQGLLTPDN